MDPKNLVALSAKEQKSVENSVKLWPKARALIEALREFCRDAAHLSIPRCASRAKRSASFRNSLLGEACRFTPGIMVQFSNLVWYGVPR